LFGAPKITRSISGPSIALPTVAGCEPAELWRMHLGSAFVREMTFSSKCRSQRHVCAVFSFMDCYTLLIQAIHPRGDSMELPRDVHPRGSPPNNQHPLARKLCRVVVLLRVHHVSRCVASEPLLLTWYRRAVGLIVVTSSYDAGIESLCVVLSALVPCHLPSRVFTTRRDGRNTEHTSIEVTRHIRNSVHLRYNVTTLLVTVLVAVGGLALHLGILHDVLP
jgi:hypothetical protein